MLIFQLEEGLVKEDADGKEEPDFIETHCHWKDCDRDYGTQDDLVKVIYFILLKANNCKVTFMCLYYPQSEPNLHKCWIINRFVLLLSSSCWYNLLSRLRTGGNMSECWPCQWSHDITQFVSCIETLDTNRFNFTSSLITVEHKAF